MNNITIYRHVCFTPSVLFWADGATRPWPIEVYVYTCVVFKLFLIERGFCHYYASASMSLWKPVRCNVDNTVTTARYDPVSFDWRAVTPSSTNLDCARGGWPARPFLRLALFSKRFRNSLNTRSDPDMYKNWCIGAYGHTEPAWI